MSFHFYFTGKILTIDLDWIVIPIMVSKIRWRVQMKFPEFARQNFFVWKIPCVRFLDILTKLLTFRKNFIIIKRRNNLLKHFLNDSWNLFIFIHIFFLIWKVFFYFIIRCLLFKKCFTRDEVGNFGEFACIELVMELFTAGISGNPRTEENKIPTRI